MALARFCRYIFNVLSIFIDSCIEVFIEILFVNFYDFIEIYFLISIFTLIFRRRPALSFKALYCRHFSFHQVSQLVIDFFHKIFIVKTEKVIYFILSK